MSHTRGKRNKRSVQIILVRASRDLSVALLWLHYTSIKVPNTR